MAKTWQTVRVFISSTFRDMHAERDYLVKVTFPELRERMARRNLHLVDIDLRWGVTEAEAEQGKVLDIILDEVDRSRPFFIALLGERYGFVPSGVTEDTEFTHPWIKDYPEYSLTALEIVHAVLRNPDTAKRSFFYIRDPGFISQVPEQQRADFLSDSSEATQKLIALKEKIRRSGRPVMENYPCRWDDAQNRLVDLDIFGKRVMEDLWSVICAEYPEEALEADPLTIERQIQGSFAEERSRFHLGRITEAQRLTKYVQGTDRRPAVITGESGCGKSAFIATWCRKYTTDHPDDIILAYFIGATPDSTNHLRLLRNMCLELKRTFSLNEEIPADDKKLSETLAVLLSAAARDKERVILVIDALDQLAPLDTAHGLGWLLDYMPEKARLIVSSLEGDCLDVLRRHQAKEIALAPLTADEQRQIVQVLLNEWRRKLDERQTAALLAHPGTKNPLYLRIALEELRLFSNFEQLTIKINTLADDIPSLFEQVLSRLEQDHGVELVSGAFSQIAASRYGLSENELLQLLKREGEEQFPRILWARLSRSISTYLVQRGELIGFFHRQLAEAVSSRYPELKTKHAKLASYFATAPPDRKLDEYPYQLQQAQDWTTLAKALSDLTFFDYAYAHNRKYEWIGYWRSLDGQFEPEECYQAAVEEIEKSEKDGISTARVSGKIGSFLEIMGKYHSALSFLMMALNINEKALGPDHLDLATSLSNLAALYYSQGKYDEALPLYRRALAIDEKALGPDHMKVAVSLTNLAWLYRAQGKYNEALPLSYRALAIEEKSLGSDHHNVAVSLNCVAGLYSDQGKYDEALPLYRRALAIEEKALGPDHPDVATALDNLAGLYSDQGKYDEAMPLYLRALAIGEKALGPDHPVVATSLAHLAALCYYQGKYDEAMPLYLRALAIHEKAMGPDHPYVATGLSNLATLYRAQGKYDEALPLSHRALAINEKALGPDHPYVAISLGNLAGLYNAQGKYEEALPLYRRALAIGEKALGPDHPDVATSLDNLAGWYSAQSKNEEALPLYRRSLAIYEKALGPDHPMLATGLNNLAALYYYQGNYDEALPLYRRALAIYEKELGPDHPNVANSLNNLSTLYCAQGKYDEALPLCRRSLAIYEKELGPDHPKVATSLAHLAALCYYQGK